MFASSTHRERSSGVDARTGPENEEVARSARCGLRPGSPHKGPLVVDAQSWRRAPCRCFKTGDLADLEVVSARVVNPTRVEADHDVAGSTDLTG
jgi:hypothetical protein